MKALYSILILITLVILCFGCSSSTDSTAEAPPVTPPPAAQELVYFWFFDESIPNDEELERLDATFSSSNSSAVIEFQSALSGYPHTERNASMERRNRPTAINYQPAGNQNKPYSEVQKIMRGIQVKEPFAGDAGENSLILSLPMIGYERAILKFAAMDEGAAQKLRFDYSISAGTAQWITAGLSTDQVEQNIVTGEYLPMEVDFTGISGINNNPDFKVRIRFIVEDGRRNEGDRVAFNNFSLKAAQQN